MTEPTTITDADIRAHADLVWAICLRTTGGDHALASDACQEVFVAWLRHRDRIRGPAAAWLATVARTTSLDLLRRGHRRSGYEAAGGVPAVQDPDCDAETRAALDASLADLGDRDRALLLEHHVLGRSQSELAARWRCSQATISRALVRAGDRLKHLLVRRGVTAVVLTVLLAELRAAPCPDGLVAPVLAQARVGGGASLLGGGLRLGRAAWAWVGIGSAAAILVALAGYGWSYGRTLFIVHREMAGLMEPYEQTPVRLTNARIRYPSIEVLIARLPVVDATEQRATDDLWAEWQRLPSYDSSNLKDVAKARIMLTQYAPLARRLIRQSAGVGIASYLAHDYDTGAVTPNSFSWWVSDKRSNVLHNDLRWIVRYSALLVSSGDRESSSWIALTDAIVRSMNDHACTLIEGLLAISVRQVRDQCYVKGIRNGSLDEAAILRWLAEPAPRDDIAAYLRADLEAYQIPILQDVVHGLIDLKKVQQSEEMQGWLVGLGGHEVSDVLHPSIGASNRLAARIAGMTAQQLSDIRCLERGSLPDWSAERVYALTMLLDHVLFQRFKHHAERLTVRCILFWDKHHRAPIDLDELGNLGANAQEIHDGSPDSYALQLTTDEASKTRISIDLNRGGPAWAIEAHQRNPSKPRPLIMKDAIGRIPGLQVVDYQRLDQPIGNSDEDIPTPVLRRPIGDG